MDFSHGDKPLYSYPLPEIESWLANLGAQQDREELNRWQVEKSEWQAEICLDTEEIVVQYFDNDQTNSSVTRSFKYSLNRQDIEDAILAGP